MKNEIKNGVLVIPLEGSLVGALANGPLMDLLKSNIATGNKKVLFDMSEMRYIDSTGLGMLLNAITKIQGAGGQLVICSVPEQMQKLLKMTKLEHAFKQQPDEASALAFLNA